MFKLKPRQQEYWAIQVPKVINMSAAKDLVDLQKKLHKWELDLQYHTAEDEYGVEALLFQAKNSPRQFEAYPGDWIILRTDGAFTISPSADARTLFELAGGTQCF